MIDVELKSFPTLLKTYIHAVNRFYPSTIQLVILSYLAAQGDPLPQSYILQKLQRIYPKHSEKMLFTELAQLCMKRLIHFDSEQRYWIDLHYIQTEFEDTFRTMEADLTQANIDENIMSLFMQLKKQVVALQANMLQFLPTFYQTRNKDLKKFFRNIIRKYRLDSLYIAFEKQTVGEPIDFITLTETLTRDLTQKISEIPPTIRAPLGRNSYNAYRKVKTYNDTAKGTRLFFYSEKLTDTTNTDNPPAIHKDSIVFGVPRIGEHIPKSLKAISKKKKEKGNSSFPSKENFAPLEIDASNNEKKPHPIKNQPIIYSNPNFSMEIQEKRRGRPPKPKDSTPMDSLPPRPRGRPPKLKPIELPTGESPPSHPLSTLTDEAKSTPIIIPPEEIDPFLTILETKYGQFSTRSQIIAAVTESVNKLTTNYNRASNIRTLILLHYLSFNRTQSIPKLSTVLKDLNISSTQFENQKTRFIEWEVISPTLQFEIK